MTLNEQHIETIVETDLETGGIFVTARVRMGAAFFVPPEILAGMEVSEIEQLEGEIDRQLRLAVLNNPVRYVRRSDQATIVLSADELGIIYPAKLTEMEYTPTPLAPESGYVDLSKLEPATPNVVVSAAAEEV